MRKPSSSAHRDGEVSSHDDDDDERQQRQRTPEYEEVALPAAAAAFSSSSSTPRSATISEGVGRDDEDVARGAVVVKEEEAEVYVVQTLERRVSYIQEYLQSYTQQGINHSDVNAWRLRLPRSLFLFGGMHPFRFAMLRLMMHPAFNLFIMFCILCSSILLAVDQPAVDLSDGVDMFLKIADYFFTIAFVVEMMIKIIALGFLLHRGAYLRNAWNVMDFVIVVTNIVGIAVVGFSSTGSTTANASAGMKAIRVLRVLRPLRTLTKVRPLQKLVTTLLMTIPAVIDNMFLFIFILFLFAVTGLTLFRGNMDQRCYVTGFPSLSPTSTLLGSIQSVPSNWSWGTTNQTVIATALANYQSAGVNLSAFTALGTGPFQLAQNMTDFCGGVLMCGGPAPLIGGPAMGEVVGTIWDSGVQLPLACDVHIDLFQPRNMNFNSIFTAMLLVNKIITFDNWPDDLKDCLNYAGEIMAYPFFILLTFTGGYCCISLFLALLSDGYESAAEKHGGVLGDESDDDSGNDDEDEDDDENDDEEEPLDKSQEEPLLVESNHMGGVEVTAQGNEDVEMVPVGPAPTTSNTTSSGVESSPEAAGTSSPPAPAPPDVSSSMSSKRVLREHCACQVMMSPQYDPELDLHVQSTLSTGGGIEPEYVSEEILPSEIITDVSYIEQEIAAGMRWRAEDFMLTERKDAWEHQFDLEQAQEGTKIRFDLSLFPCCSGRSSRQSKKRMLQQAASVSTKTVDRVVLLPPVLPTAVATKMTSEKPAAPTTENQRSGEASGADKTKLSDMVGMNRSMEDASPVASGGGVGGKLGGGNSSSGGSTLGQLTAQGSVSLSEGGRRSPAAASGGAPRLVQPGTPTTMAASNNNNNNSQNAGVESSAALSASQLSGAAGLLRNENSGPFFASVMSHTPATTSATVNLEASNNSSLKRSLIGGNGSISSHSIRRSPATPGAAAAAGKKNSKRKGGGSAGSRSEVMDHNMSLHCDLQRMIDLELKKMPASSMHSNGESSDRSAVAVSMEQMSGVFPASDGEVASGPGIEASLQSPPKNPLGPEFLSPVELEVRPEFRPTETLRPVMITNDNATNGNRSQRQEKEAVVPFQQPQQPRPAMSWYHVWLFSRLYVGTAMTSRFWEAFTMFITLLNTVILAVDHYGIDAMTNSILDWISIACTIVFGIDVVLKLYAFLHRYFLFGWNVFDFILVVVSVVTIIYSDGGGSAFSAFRVIRVMRIFRLLVQFKNLQIIISGALKSLVATGYLLVLFFLFIFMAAVLGMQLFGLDYGLPQGMTAAQLAASVNGTTMAPPARISRDSFGTFWGSLLVDFIVITGENWSSKMRLGMTYFRNGAEIIPVIYFSLLYYIGNFIFINLSVAIIMNKLEQSMRKAAKLSAVAEKDAAAAAIDSENDTKQEVELDRSVVVHVAIDGAQQQQQQHERVGESRTSSLQGRPVGTEDVASPQVHHPDAGSNGSPTPLITTLAPGATGPRTSSSSFFPPTLILARIDPAQFDKREKATKGNRVTQRRVGSDIMSSNAQLVCLTTTSVAGSGHDATVGPAMSPPSSPKGQTANASPPAAMHTNVADAAAGEVYLGNMFLDSYEQYVHTANYRLRQLMAWVRLNIRSSPPVVVETSLNVFAITNPVRQACLYLLGLPVYKFLVFFVSFMNALILFFDAKVDSDWFSRVIVFTDIAFAVVFTVEFFIKLIALGALWPAEAEYLIEGETGLETGKISTPAYFRDLWNCLDFIAMIGALLGLGLPFLRVLRAIRCVRLMVIFKGPRVILTALIEAFPLAMNALLLSSVIMIVLAILGVQLFKGLFYSCSDGSGVNRTVCTGLVVEPPIQGAITTYVDDSATNYTASGDALVPREWLRTNYHFDHFGAAMLSIFVITVSDGWSNFLYNGMDTTDDVQGLQQNANPWMALYFVAVILCCNIFALNLTIGTLINYFTEKKSEEDGTAFLSKEHASWVRANSILAQMTNERDTLVPFRHVVCEQVHRWLTLRLPKFTSFADVFGRSKDASEGNRIGPAEVGAAPAASPPGSPGRSDLSGFSPRVEAMGLPRAGAADGSSPSPSSAMTPTSSGARRWKWLTGNTTKHERSAMMRHRTAARNTQRHNNNNNNNNGDIDDLLYPSRSSTCTNTASATPVSMNVQPSFVAASDINDDDRNGAAERVVSLPTSAPVSPRQASRRFRLRFQQRSDSSKRLRIPQEPIYRMLSVWEMLMIIIAVINCIVMASVTHTTSSESLTQLSRIQLVCLIIFTVEWVVKVLTYGPYMYLAGSAWGKFDSLVVILGWVAELLPGVRAVVLFRLLRLAKLIRGTGVDRILQRFFRSFTSLVNIIFVMMLVYFVFAVAGVSLFQNVALTGPLTPSNNFQTVFRGMTVLYQCGTTEGWSDMLLALGNEGETVPPTCSKAEGTCGNYIVAVAFMLTFMCSCAFIAVQLFVAFVVEIFDTVEEDQTTLNVFADIRDLWMENFGETTWAVNYLDFIEWLPKLPRSVTKLPQYSVTSLDIIRLVNSLPVAIDSSYRVRYSDVMVALTFLKFDVDPRGVFEMWSQSVVMYFSGMTFTLAQAYSVDVISRAYFRAHLIHQEKERREALQANVAAQEQSALGPSPPPNPILIMPQ